MPKVSIIIATYNRSYFICNAINSVLGQTFKDFELIVVDDGSTDDTKQVLTRYGSLINYLYQDNKGRAQARNAGIKLAKGEYIAFLDDDDMWLPYKLQKQVEFLDAHPEIGLIHTFIDIIDEHGNLLKETTKKHLRLYKKAMRIGYIYEGMSKQCIMFLSTVMLRKDYLDKVGFFDSRIPAFEDWDFYLRFSLKYQIATIPEPLVKYRIHQAQTDSGEFNYGRISTALKHLNMLESYDIPSARNQIRHNFYMHLANAYYIDMQLAMFRSYCLKTLSLNPLVVLRTRLALHLALSLLPTRIIKVIRHLKKKNPHLKEKRGIKPIVSILLMNPILIRFFIFLIPHRFIINLYLSSFVSSIFPKDSIFRIVSHYGNNLKMVLKAGDKLNPQETHYWLGFYELGVQRLFAKLIKQGYVVYDIGAYIGFYSLLAGRLTGPNGKVYAFEPLPRNIKRIKCHVLLNGMQDRIFCIPKIITDMSGKAVYRSFGRDDWGRSVGKNNLENPCLTEVDTLLVETASLDEFVFQDGYPAPSLIKIDVEGEEGRVLTGARRLLKEYKPFIICELHNAESARQVYEQLTSLGYKFKDLERAQAAFAKCCHIMAWPREGV